MPPAPPHTPPLQPGRHSEAGGFYARVEGTCAIPIVTQFECDAAATALGYAHLTPASMNSFGVSNRPPYCVLDIYMSGSSIDHESLVVYPLDSSQQSTAPCTPS